MNWHEPTQDEINGMGDFAWHVDIQPDSIPHQATQDGDALIRIQRPGWSWLIVNKQKRDKKDKSPIFYMGVTDTREAAIGEAFAKLAELRS